MDEYINKVFLRSFEALSFQRKLDPVWWHSSVSGTLQMDVDILLSHWSRVLFDDLERTGVWPDDSHELIVTGSCDGRQNELRERALRLVEMLLFNVAASNRNNTTTASLSPFGSVELGQSRPSSVESNTGLNLRRSAAAATDDGPLRISAHPSPDGHQYTSPQSRYRSESPERRFSCGPGINERYAEAYAQCVRQMELDGFNSVQSDTDSRWSDAHQTC